MAAMEEEVAIQASDDQGGPEVKTAEAGGGPEDDLQRMRDGNFTDEELESFQRPRNMFDITKMTYEEYCEKHFDIMGKKHNEQMLKQQMAMMQQMMSQPGGFAAASGAMPGGYGGQPGGGAGYGGGFGQNMGGGGFGQGGGGFGMGGGGGPMAPRPPPGYCNAFQRGMCKFGDNCRYKHEIPEPGAGPAQTQSTGQFPPRDPNKPAGYCNAFQKGECKFGDNCRYRHEINPRPYNPEFSKQRSNNFGMVNPNMGTSGGSTGAFAAAGYGGF